MAGRPKLRADLVRLTCLTPEDVDGMFNRLASGEALYRVADQLSVSMAALNTWFDALPERRERLKRAREIAASTFAEQSIAIADGDCPISAESPVGWEHVSRDKLRIQSRQWLASRWDRETYGDNKQAAVTINLNTLHLDALRRQPVARPVCGACNVDPCRCQRMAEQPL